MKKIIISLFVLIIVVTITGCKKEDSNLKIEYKDYSDEVIVKEYTYKFVGQSEHFYFETGKVYYTENSRQFIISNFKLKDNVESDTNYSLNVYFNDKLLVGDEYHLGGQSKEDFEVYRIAESGAEPEKDENGNYIRQPDAFFETPKEEFKDSLKVVGYYCIKDNCEKEEFKITYLDD